MKILVDLKSLKNLDLYEADGFIASSSEYSCFNDFTLSLDDLKFLSEYTKNNNKILVVNIDRLIEEEELTEFKDYLTELLKLKIDYFIYGDLAVLSYFIKLNLTHKLIYDPKTLITNYYEADFHNKYNSLVSINNELTLEEIKDITKANNTIMEVFGYHQMFYSRRALLSNYSKFKNADLDLIKKKLNIKEEKRDASYPIFESSHGTFIYTNYVYLLFKELTELNDLRFIRINGNFIGEDKLFQVLRFYNLLINDFSKADELYEKIKELIPKVDSGFLYQKSILLKEQEND